jgi:hypothetical protein
VESAFYDDSVQIRNGLQGILFAHCVYIWLFFCQCANKEIASWKLIFTLYVHLALFSQLANKETASWKLIFAMYVHLALFIQSANKEAVE